ncbi:hypothetical protein OPQ81_007617 [Rhizoctonia solani]|nr:hypothetical protein OPQ81_007617 [Rhizoctonia solani]
MTIQHCNPRWDYLGKHEHTARSFWSLLSRYLYLASCLKLLYEKGIFCYRGFMQRLTIRCDFLQHPCLNLHDATLRRTRQSDDALLETTASTFFPYLALGPVFDSQFVRPTVSSGIFSRVTSECLKIGASFGQAPHRPIQLSASTSSHNATLTTGQPTRSTLHSPLDKGVVGCNFSAHSNSPSSSLCSCRLTALGDTFKLAVPSSSKPAHPVATKSSCSTLPGTRNRNLNNFAESAAGLITLCLCFTPTNAMPIAETVQKLDAFYLIPQSSSGGLHLSRRDAPTHDANWRAMVIGSTIGSTAGAVILGIGIYLLFRARRKRRSADPSRSESQPIEMQPTIARARSSNTTQMPRSRPLPRAHPHDTSAGPSSWVAKTPRTPSIASLELQPRLLHPRDISRATHIRASTGSQFTEHFEPVMGAHRRPLGGLSPGDHDQSPVTTSHDFQRSADPQGSNQRPEPNTMGTDTPIQTPQQSKRPRTDSQMTAPLPPGAAAPVESIGSYSPPEASNAPNTPIRLS